MKNALFAALGVALVASLGSVPAANATTSVVDFGASPASGKASYTGSNLGSATAFNLGTTSFTVFTVGGDDTTGIASGDAVSISPDYVIALSVGALSHDLTKAWITTQGAFVETLTSITYVGGHGNFLDVSFAGSITGPGFVDAVASMSLAASQNGGPKGAIAYSVSDSATVVASGVPETSTWVMMVAGFAGLGFAGTRRTKTAFVAA
jgi:hypothetical protein